MCRIIIKVLTRRKIGIWEYSNFIAFYSSLIAIPWHLTLIFQTGRLSSRHIEYSLGTKYCHAELAGPGQEGASGPAPRTEWAMHLALSLVSTVGLDLVKGPHKCPSPKGKSKEELAPCLPLGDVGAGSCPIPLPAPPRGKLTLGS